MRWKGGFWERGMGRELYEGDLTIIDGMVLDHLSNSEHGERVVLSQ